MKRLVLIAASVLLASCGALTDMAGLRDDGSSTEKWPDVGQKPGDARKRSSDSEVYLRPPHDLRAVPKPKTKPRKVKRIKPKTLVGMTREQVKTLIGDPVTIADRPPATVWSYRTTGCALEVFFYLDVASKKFRALTYELKGDKGVRIAPNLCLGKIRAVRYGS
ncbi:MAG: hypothetical protein HOM58_20240 [Rhodospirillaceae bacterium]|jgi:hypothetical protein|nr:hypothetical protein [Rhodospirillaceae bacterium]